MKHWKRFFSVTMCAALFLFPGCSLAEEADPEPPVRSDTGAASSVPDASSEEESSVPMKPVQRIDMRTAKANLDADEAIVLLDVRTKTEYDDRHIPGSVLVPLNELYKKASGAIPKKDSTVYVYCRSGRRSYAAAEVLMELGYENVYDMGGLDDWPFETEYTKSPL